MTTDHTRAGSREWAGLAVLALPALLASMDLSVLFIAAPALAAELRPSAAQLLWVLDAYGFLMAGLLLTMGALGDRIGRRRVLLAGAAAFGGASVLAACSTTAEMLIAARALLGVGGATLAPSTLALLRDMFRDDAQRRAAIGTWTAVFTGGVAVGPIVGGLLVERFGWGSVFLINVPVMVVLLVVGPVLLPESRDPAGGRLDPLGAAQSIVAVLLLVHGGKEIAAGGSALTAAGALVAGAAVGAVFVRRQSRSRDPLIDIGLFRDARFGAALAAYTVAVMGSAGLGFLIAQFLQVGLGLGALAAALWQLPAVVGAVAGIGVATAASGRVRPAAVLVAGLVVSAAGFVLLGLVGQHSAPIDLLAGCALVGAGTGIVAARAIDVVVAAAPAHRAGAAAGLGETGAELGGALGIAVLGSVVTTVYRTGTADPPTALPAAGEPLAATARQAFTEGFTTAAWAGAALLAAAALALALVRGREWKEVL